MKTLSFSCTMTLLSMKKTPGLESSLTAPMAMMYTMECLRFVSFIIMLVKIIVFKFSLLILMSFHASRIIPGMMLLLVTFFRSFLETKLHSLGAVARLWIVVQMTIFSYITLTMVVLGCLVSRTLSFCLIGIAISLV